MAATGAVISGRNSSIILVGRSPGTLHVFLPFLKPSCTRWSDRCGWQQGSFSSLSWTWWGSAAVSSGEYSWLMELKNSQIRLDDSSADRLSSTCLGRENEGVSWSPGRAAILFTCLSQELIWCLHNLFACQGSWLQLLLIWSLLFFSISCISHCYRVFHTPGSSFY